MALSCRSEIIQFKQTLHLIAMFVKPGRKTDRAIAVNFGGVLAPPPSFDTIVHN